MGRINLRKLFFVALVLYSGSLSAQTKHEVRDSVRIYFRQGKVDLMPEFRNNKRSLERIADSLQTNYTDSIYKLRQILVIGGASPEGSMKLNKWLSKERANVLFDYLSRYGTLPDSLKKTEFIGRDWNGLVSMVEKDPGVPHREETLTLLRDIAQEERSGIMGHGDPLGRIQRLKDGAPYHYMYRHIFPELRASKLHLWYEKVCNPVAPMVQPITESMVSLTDTVSSPHIAYISMPKPKTEKPFYMDIRTNMIYDALIVPNLGIEFYLGKDWSVVGNWMYAWWKNGHRHRYWRIYGGDITLRRWFGQAAKEKPLTGHHIGIYGQIFTYDFEWGGTGYMGGKPGGTLWNRMNYAVGVEYGYSLPIARRLNIDFSIGIGYWGGTYHEYEPMDDCYVWQRTKNRHWFGATKAEVSLAWLLGRGNYNKEKGGKR